MYANADFLNDYCPHKSSGKSRYLYRSPWWMKTTAVDSISPPCAVRGTLLIRMLFWHAILIKTDSGRDQQFWIIYRYEANQGLTHLSIVRHKYISKTGFVFQIMDCRPFGTKLLSKQTLCYWHLRNAVHWYCTRNTKRFIYKNAYEIIVCETATILSRGRWVNVP